MSEMFNEAGPKATIFEGTEEEVKDTS